MRKKILPLIALSICLISTPVHASEKTINAIIPVSCTAKNSDDEFKVSMHGDSEYQASPEILNLKDGETEDFSVSFDTPGTYKYTVIQESGNNTKMTYDKTIYNADVYVTEDDQGVLSAETIVYKNGSNNKLSECSFTNTVEDDNASVTPAADDSNGINATDKSSSSSTTSGINTGVITHEGLYALIGLAGITTMLVSAKKRREKK